MTVSDLRCMVIDDRHNYFMFGIVLSLIALRDVGILYVLLLLGVALFLRFMCKRLLKEGDLNAVSWIIVGSALLDSSYTVLFLLFLVYFSLVVVVYKYALGLRGKSPGLPVLFGSFLIVSVLYITVN